MTAMLLAAAIAAASLAPAEREPTRVERLATLAIAANVITQFVDGGVTLYAIGRFGCDDAGRSRAGQQTCLVEANPLLRWTANDPVVLSVIKGLGAIATTQLLLKLKKTHPKIATAVAVASSLFTSYVVHRNLGEIRRHQK